MEINNNNRTRYKEEYRELTVHRPPSTVHRPPSTVHRPPFLINPLSLAVSAGLLFAHSGIVAAGCDTSLITANLAEPRSQCVEQCSKDFNGHTSMDCTRVHVENTVCPEYCAQARDDSCESFAGNPINLSDGSKYQEETDYVGGGSNPLEIRRHFRSIGNRDSAFGYNWSGLVSSRVEVRFTQKDGDVFNVVKQDGSIVSFYWADVVNNTIVIVPYKSTVADKLSMFQEAGAWVLNFTSSDGTVDRYDINMTEYGNTNRYTSKLLWRQFTTGEKHYFSYASDGTLDSIADDFGNKLQYTYHPSSHHVASIAVTPGNRVYRYDYDANGNLTHVYFPDDTPANTTDDPFKRYHYEDARFTHYLTGITDERGKRYATFAYNEDGKAISTEHAGGVDKVEVVSYAEPNGGVRVRNALGKDTIYRYTKTGSGASTSKRLTAVDGQASSNCAASNSTYSYDANGFRDKITDGRGFVTDLDHNALGQEIRRTEALGQQEQRTTETDWYPGGTIKEIRAPGKTTRFTYTQGNGLGRLTSRTEIDTTTHSAPYATQGLSRTWSYSYTYHDAPANLKVATVTVDGPRADVNDTTVQHLNPAGQVDRIEQHSGSGAPLVTEITAFTAEGLPQTVVDPNGIVTQLSYTPRGWLKTRTTTTPKGPITTTYEYDNAGQVTKTILPTGVALNYLYDDAHRLQEISTDDNERITWELTALGDRRMERVQSSSGSLRRIVHQEFDDLGRLWKRFGVQDQVLETYGYDANGNPETTTDANQRTITRAFDGLNRLRSVTERDTGATQYEYNAQDQLVALTDPNGLTTSWVVDGFGRKIQETSPDRGTTVYRYDLADNLIQKTDARNSVTKYSYDALNRLTEIQYPASAQDNVSLKYDETSLPTANGSVAHKGKGRLTSAIVANGDKTQWAYDALGNITNDVRVQAGKTFQTTYTYNAAGQLITLGYPSGRELSYGYDNKGRIHQLRSRTSSTASWTTLANNLSYEPFGPLTGFTWGNGLTETLSYDTHYQPETIQTRSGSSDVRSLQYGFNLANELDHLTDAKTPARSQLFSYDPNGRLNQAQGQYGTLAYQYDLTGNRVSQAQTNATNGQNFTESYQYPATSHQLTQVNVSGQGGQNRSFQYSATGNLTQDERYTYVYNDANRLTQVMSGPAVIAEYRYNHLGERISKTTDGKTTQFIYDPNHQLLAEHHQDGTPIRDYVYLGSKLLAMVDADTTTNPDTGTKADLAITLKGATGNSVKQPDGRYQVTYKVNVQNAGGSAAENVVLTNTFPATDVNLVSYTASQGTCTEDASTCDLGTISAGQTATVTLIASKGQKAKENFSASVTTSSEESNTDNNSATAAFGGAFGLWIMAFLTAMLGLRTRFAKHALNRKNTISTACLLLCGLSLMGANTSQAEQIYYVHTDHLNTPTLVTDSNKTVVWEGVRKPFGETEEVVATVRQPIRFPGQYFDGETGLAYNLMRDYDARVGRYVQSDPIGLAGGVSAYGYAGQNPITNYDSDGMYWRGMAGVGVALCLKNPRLCKEVGKDAWKACKRAQKKIWDKARKEYWKWRAAHNNGEYSPEDLARMTQGKPPRHTEFDVSKELHHEVPQREGGSNSADNLKEVWPWEHDSIDPYRNYKGPRPDGW
ncbi:Rhs family protein [gamma proteobacterium HdN1]|nr:Rhs family protein [gamma proteobacterium HdN1]